VAPPVVTGVLETALYVGDVERSALFYEDLFGFKRLIGDSRFCALNVAEKQVLLLFERGGTAQWVPTPGGGIPQHDGSGTMHFALAIPKEDLDAWQKRLELRGIVIESRVRWPLGGTSLYFRDPDQHLVELATPGIWAIF
jgi:catechol 2,3-dioxygenase-like lactoylglutathione lyase family enzyme